MFFETYKIKIKNVVLHLKPLKKGDSSMKTMRKVPRLEEFSRKELIDFLRETVKPTEGIVPAYIFSHPVIHELEMEKIFLKTWQLVAHESELSKPGDFVTRELANHSVIVTRADDGKIRTLLNKCTHRGMRICRADKGNRASFTCPYHGFNFKNTGDLIGVPLQNEVYGKALNRSKMCLRQARTESYAGLIFATWNQDAPSLDEYLGDMKWYLDFVANRAEMEVMGPPQRWVVNTSWKLGADNAISDSYHTMVTHASIARLGLVPSADFSKYGYQINTGNGHGLNLGLPNPTFAFAEELIPEFKQRLSPEQFDILCKMKNAIGNVFPNLMFLISSTDFKGKPISNTTIRLWRPIGPGKTEIVWWVLVEKNAPQEWKERSRQVAVLTFSSSGIFEQDDTENWIDITDNSKGLLHLQDNFSYQYLAGLDAEPVEFVGPGVAYSNKFYEANAREFYRRWLELILADE